MVLVKKYSNRRLYDTAQSRYITLEELAATVRTGEDVQVVDASSGEDLTQGTLAQIVLEGPASRLLPASLLHQLIRLQDDAFVDFFGRYVAWALDMYGATRGGTAGFGAWPPFGFGAGGGGGGDSDEVRRLREDLERLREEVRRDRSDD